MGSYQSKATGEHVFQGGSQAQFGHNLVDTLQQNPESDATRWKSAELEIQQRIAEELKRLQEKEDRILQEVEDKISKETPNDSKLDRSTVSHSISVLANKLSSQSKISTESEGIKRAEGAVIRCLRLNDRRPLDCWVEVENFRQEVSRMEKSFVGKVVGDL